MYIQWYTEGPHNPCSYEALNHGMILQDKGRISVPLSHKIIRKTNNAALTKHTQYDS
jgi:hypothetical protein